MYLGLAGKQQFGPLAIRIGFDVQRPDSDGEVKRSDRLSLESVTQPLSLKQSSQSAEFPF